MNIPGPFFKDRVALFVFLRAVINVPHIGAVHAEDTEADIKIGGRQRGLFLDFSAGATDAFFADVADSAITSFIGFAFFVTNFK